MLILVGYTEYSPNSRFHPSWVKPQTWSCAPYTMAVRTVREADGFYDASQHLDEVEGRIISWNMDKDNYRHLSSLDLFAGKGNFCDECEKQNYQSMTVNVKEDPVNHDILSRTGFNYILDAILTIVPLPHEFQVTFW